MEEVGEEVGVVLESFLIHDQCGQIVSSCSHFKQIEFIFQERCESWWDLQILWRSYKMKKEEFHLGSGISIGAVKLPFVTGEENHVASPRTLSVQGAVANGIDPNQTLQLLLGNCSNEDLSAGR